MKDKCKFIISDILVYSSLTIFIISCFSFLILTIMEQNLWGLLFFLLAAALVFICLGVSDFILNTVNN